MLMLMMFCRWQRGLWWLMCETHLCFTPPPCTHPPCQLKALVEEGKSLPKYTDPPLNGRPKPIVDAGRDAFF